MISRLINKGYDASECYICKVKFNLLKLQRIHKCKRCNRFICLKCGNQKEKVLDDEGKWTNETHRICTDCGEELARVAKLIEKKKIKWGKDSLFSQEWISRIQAISSEKGSKANDYEYRHFLNLFQTNAKNFEEERDIINKDVIKGRTDYVVFNYSLRDFIYTVQSNSNNTIREQARINMANVLYAIAARFDQVGYVQGMSSIAAYLLCFCTEESAYSIFCDIIENILPKNFLIRGEFGTDLIGLMAEIHFLKEYFVHLLTNVKGKLICHFREPYTEEELGSLRMKAQLCASKALLSLFVNFLSYLPIEFIWNQFSLLRNFEVAERAFLAAIYLKRDQLLKVRSFRHIECMFQGLEIDHFIQAYYDMDIDNTIKVKLIEQFYESFNKKWSNSGQSVKQLRRYTNFTEDEIKLLQQKFNVQKSEPFANEEMGVINKQDFIFLINCYYDVLKEKEDTNKTILELSPNFISKIFDSFHSKKSPTEQEESPEPHKNLSLIELSDSQEKPDLIFASKYLNFRQFVCCFSLCTKSLLKERLCAIINVLNGKNKKISLISFEKLVKNLCEISPPDIDEKKEAFLERINRYFANQQDGITPNELSILLNDNFINQLTLFIGTDEPHIIPLAIDRFFKGKTSAECL